MLMTGQQGVGHVVVSAANLMIIDINDLPGGGGEQRNLMCLSVLTNRHDETAHIRDT